MWQECESTIPLLTSIYAYSKASWVALEVKNPPANSGDIRDVGSIPGLGRSPGGWHGNPRQYSCLENPMDRGAWCATVQRVKYDWNNWTCTHSEVEDAHTLSFSNSSSRKHIYRVMKGYNKSIRCSIICKSNKKRSNSKMSTRTACLRKLFIKGHITYQLKWMCICYRWTRTNLKIIMLGEKTKLWTITCSVI